MSVNNEKLKELFEKAENVSKNSYSPYSEFPVGAAILVDDDLVFCGTNVENRSYGGTNCAERTAIFSAIAQGKRNFKALVLATPKAEYPVPPCGICRQVISEFTDKDFPIIYGNSWESHIETTIGKLYPEDSLHELAK